MTTNNPDDPEPEAWEDSGAIDQLHRLYQHLGDGRREIYDRMPIDPQLDVAAALRRMPAHWLKAACLVLRLEQSCGPRSNRKVRGSALLGALQSTATLAEILNGLPTRSLFALRAILEAGGCAALLVLTQEFGEMEGDGWLWDQRLPTSCLGALRCRALLHVGRLRVEQDGGLPDLYVPVAVVPQDIREMLGSLLGVQAEGSFEFVEPPADADDLQAALIGVERCFALSVDTFGLDRAVVEQYLRRCATEGASAHSAWQHLEILFEFAAHNLHEIQTVEDICAFHLSELVTEFVDRRQAPRWSLAQRRGLIETVVHFIGILHAWDLASGAVAEEMTHAERTLMSGRRRLELIRRPLPLGGEPVFLYDDEALAGRRTYTVNHRRIAVAWWSEFDQDWDALLVACDAVVDGGRKADVARELMSVDAAICELLLACAEEDEPEFVSQWFREDPLLLVRAW